MSKRCCARNCFNTIITNKNVEYFGFPKSEDFARKWAIAAGRNDLLDKPLNNIIKYYLCSSHFTEDCFTDNTHTQLRKQSRPKVIVPIPSIFKNNITEFIPDAVKETISIDLEQGINEEISNPFTRQEDIEKEEEKRVHVYIVPEPDPQIEPTINEDCLILYEEEEDDKNFMAIENQCRLCAKIFQDPLVPIFNTEEPIIESIERLLPETVFLDDGKPQQICWTCYHKMNQCIDIINSFNIAQVKFD